MKILLILRKKYMVGSEEVERFNRCADPHQDKRSYDSYHLDLI